MRFLLLFACGADPAAPMATPPPTEQPAAGVDARRWLSPTDHLVRVSMALRGLRPSPADLERVADDPVTIDEIVDRYLDDPAFGENVRDMHAELFRVRVDVERVFPALGSLAGAPQLGIDASVMEGPLRLVEAIVLDDRPYTDIVTSDEVWVDATSARVWGVPYDERGPDWQASRWTDGRPAAGILSDSAVFVRHGSVGGNANRGRAELVADALLCQSFLDRDVTVDGSVDLADEAAVAEAVEADPSCVSCHQALDPLAASFWGHRGRLSRARIQIAHDGGCPPALEHYCYPLEQWVPGAVEAWRPQGLRAPAFYGQPTDDLAHLGEQIADDPRFSLCTAQRVDGYLTQTPRDEVPHDRAATWQQVLVDEGFSLRAMIRAIVLSDAFRSVATAEPERQPAVALQTVRPEQFARVVEQLTGFVWGAEADRLPDCAARDACLGPVDLGNSDLFGFRAMAGGIDGVRVTFPAHDPTPIKALVTSTFANEAAGYVVATDLALPPADRRLLDQVTPEGSEEDDRAQLVALHARILGRLEAPDGPAVDATLALLDDVRATSDDASAWQAVVSALLQHPRLTFY